MRRLIIGMSLLVMSCQSTKTIYEEEHFKYFVKQHQIEKDIEEFKNGRIKNKNNFSIHKELRRN